LTGLVSALWRAKLWIILPVIVVMALVVLWLSSATPLYRSTAKLLVENQETAFTQPAASAAERTLLDQEAIKSQVQLILSADLSRYVIQELRLDTIPEFNPKSAPSPVSRVLALFGITRDPVIQSNEQRVLANYYDHLTVYQVDSSRVIAIEFTSQDPELAARAANAVARGYIELQQAAERSQTQEASVWLRDQVDTLRERVNEAERDVETFRSEYGLFSGSGSGSEPRTLTSQQLSELTSELSAARVQKSDAQARARLIRDALESGRPLESSEVLNSPIIQGLTQQQVQLRAQIAELSSTLGPRHPRMRELEAQLGDLRRQIREEAVLYARAAEKDAEVAAAREQDLLENLDQLKARAAQSNEDEVELRALEREAKSQRDLLESLLGRYREALAREGLETPPANARLISVAAPAADPFYPKTLPVLIVAFLGSVLMACGVVVTLELFRSTETYPEVAPLPRTIDVSADASTVAEPRTQAPADDGPPSSPPRSAPVSASISPSPSAPVPVFSDAVARTPEILVEGPVRETGFNPVRDEILARSHGDLAHTVLFTSVRDLPALNSLALQLARAVSARGRRVVVVDTRFGTSSPVGAPADRGTADRGTADRGTADRETAGRETAEAETADDRTGEPQFGLGDLLSGEAAFEAAIQRDRGSRVHIIQAGDTASDPLLLVASDRMETTLEALRHTYDVVLLLAASVARHGEARLLARRADQAVLLSDGAKGDPALKRARDRLEDAGLAVISTLRVETADGTQRVA